MCSENNIVVTIEIYQKSIDIEYLIVDEDTGVEASLVTSDVAAIAHLNCCVDAVVFNTCKFGEGGSNIVVSCSYVDEDAYE